MKIPKTHQLQDKLFDRQGYHGYHDLIRNKERPKKESWKIERILSNRAHRLNKSFEYTPENVQEFLNLSIRVLKQTKKAFAHAKKLEDLVLKEMSNEDSDVVDSRGCHV